MKTATKTYGFAGKTVAQRTAAGGTVKLAFITSDSVDTTQTILQPSSGTTPFTAQTRYTNPIGLARGPPRPQRVPARTSIRLRQRSRPRTGRKL
ncbi:hypothetical protein [Arthrobacter sp. MA-N2]|uniref:hypothetical protein n=1 Tax=Arthrobacter sp. MA-N2 TaxID=1101188 RepID=UPI00047F5E18|nr:hypothetical protein [Arthrobacter sp. MA-N2]